MSKKRTPLPPPPSPWRRRLGWGILAVALTVMLGVGGFALGQSWQRSAADSESPVADGYPGQLLKAAETLRASEYGFTVEQISTTGNASASPTPTPVPGTTTSEVRFVSKGAVKVGVFWQYIYSQPIVDVLADMSHATLEFSYLFTPEGAWRNNGDGWIPTQNPPGIGMDRVSAARLPDLLSHLSGVAPVPADAAHAGLTGFVGAGDPADYPGVLAADGFAYTDAPLVVTAWLGADGRVAEIQAATANLAFVPEQVLTLTTIHFEYMDVGSAPLPSPLRTEEPATIDQPQSSPVVQP